MKASAFLRMSLMMAAMAGDGFGQERFSEKKRDRSNNHLPYFYFEHEGKKYTIQAVNEVSAKAKFDKIISKKK